MRSIANKCSLLIRCVMVGVLLTLTASCTTMTIDEVRSGYTDIGENESVVVIGRRHKSNYETELDFVRCVGNNLQSSQSDLNVISEQVFADNLYPWFEPRTAPVRMEALSNMLERPEITQRITDLGVRFIVWVDGSTETTDKAGSVACSIGPGGAGCIGFGTWDNESNYEASIWDFQSRTSVGQISADAKGTSYMPAIIVPIPLIARVKSNACKGLGDQLRGFLVSGEQG